MISRFAALAVLCGIVITTTAAAADPKTPITREFTLATTSDMPDQAGGKGRVTAETSYRYAWTREGKEKTLTISEMTVKGKAADGTALDLKMSRAGAFGTENGKKVEEKYENATKQEQQQMRDMFEAPLCKIEIDATGKEVKRTIVAGPGVSKDSVGVLIHTATTFHPPYPADKDTWDADSAVLIAGGKGELKMTLAKVAGGKGGQAVKATGVLAFVGPKAADKNVKCAVGGTMTYDPDRQEWVSGKLEFDMVIEKLQGDKVVETTKGKITMTFEMLPEKKK